jgi:DNA polymerase III delta prime subunit
MAAAAGNAFVLGSAQDFKRALDGDDGGYGIRHGVYTLGDGALFVVPSPEAIKSLYGIGLLSPKDSTSYKNVLNTPRGDPVLVIERKSLDTQLLQQAPAKFSIEIHDGENVVRVLDGRDLVVTDAPFRDISGWTSASGVVTKKLAADPHFNSDFKVVLGRGTVNATHKAFVLGGVVEIAKARGTKNLRSGIYAIGEKLDSIIPLDGYLAVYGIRVTEVDEATFDDNNPEETPRLLLLPPTSSSPAKAKLVQNSPPRFNLRKVADGLAVWENIPGSKPLFETIHVDGVQWFNDVVTYLESLPGNDRVFDISRFEVAGDAKSEAKPSEPHKPHGPPSHRPPSPVSAVLTDCKQYAALTFDQLADDARQRGDDVRLALLSPFGPPADERTIKAAVPITFIDRSSGAVVSDPNGFAKRIEATIAPRSQLPPNGFDAVKGFEDLKHALRARARSRRGARLLLTGPPGTGKTLLAKAFASDAGLTLFLLTAASIPAVEVLEPERFIQELFATARRLGPAAIFIDEVDGLEMLAFGKDAGSAPINAIANGMITYRDVHVLFATNKFWRVPRPLMLMVDDVRLVGLPTPEARTALFKSLLSGVLHETDLVNLETLVNQSHQMSAADVATACARVKTWASRWPLVLVDAMIATPGRIKSGMLKLVKASTPLGVGVGVQAVSASGGGAIANLQPSFLRNGVAPFKMTQRDVLYSLSLVRSELTQAQHSVYNTLQVLAET